MAAFLHLRSGSTSLVLREDTVVPVLPPTYRVGPGQTYTSLAALPTLVPGDIVEIVAGTVLFEAIKFTADGTAEAPITIRGEAGDGFPALDGTGVTISGGGGAARALFQIEGDYYVINHLEFRDARNLQSIGSCIRSLGGSTRVVDCLIHSSDLGVMSGQSGITRFERCTIHSCGVDAYAHNFYMGGDEFHLIDCHVYGATTGQNVKSRARVNVIAYNYIHDSTDGEVGLVDGPNTAGPHANSLVIGNLIVSRVRPVGNNQTKFIDFGQDQGLPHDGTCFVYHNTMVAANGLINFIRATAPAGSVVVKNNAFDGSDIIANPTSLGMITGARNWLPVTAPAPAGFTENVRFGDPLFVDPDEDDYTPQAESQLRDRALTGLTWVNGSGVTISVSPIHHPEGSSRPTEGIPDLGCLEATGPPAIILPDPPAPAISIADQTLAAGVAGDPFSSAWREVTLSVANPAYDRSISAAVTASDGTAVGTGELKDYSVQYSEARATFAAGASTTTWGLFTSSGGVGKTFTLTLSDPSAGTTLGDATATITLVAP